MLISLTDKLDGYLARSRNEVTTFGKFLDPIADKLVVLVALAFLLEQGMTSSWVIFIVVTREFLVSGLRMVVASKGVVIAANMWGKTKTVSQMAMVILMIANLDIPAMQIVTTAVMYIACALTLISLVTYIIDNKDVMTSM